MISNISNLTCILFSFFFLKVEITERKWINEENEVIKKIRYGRVNKNRLKTRTKELHELIIYILYLIYINPYFDLLSIFLWNSTEKFSSRKYAFQRGTNCKHSCSMSGTINSQFRTKVKLIKMLNTVRIT